MHNHDHNYAHYHCFVLSLLFHCGFPELERFERREFTFILPCHCPAVLTIFVGHSRAGLQGCFTGRETSPPRGGASIPDIHDQCTVNREKTQACLLRVFQLCLQACRQANCYGGLETTQEYESRISCFFATHQLRLRMTLKTFDVNIYVRSGQQATII